ncbi:MAG TPA: HEAT repeat domain-containing protein [Polyangiales bacterium]|nr:HEAT repeat domain-containing protein [Polyangiales bacterium]
MSGIRGARATGCSGLWLCLALLCAPLSHAAADDHGVLVRLLTDSSSFRVRARAALALGSTADAGVSGPLEQALHDAHPLVRASAARALGNVGTRRSVSPLRAAASDRTPEVSDQAKLALRSIAAREAISLAVPQQSVSAARANERASLDRVRYVLVVGEMRPPSTGGSPQLTGMLAQQLTEALRELPQVAVFSLAQMTQTVADEIERRRLPAFRIDANLVRADAARSLDALDMRCEVSLLLMDEPDRTLRSMLRGAASASEQPRGPRELQQPRLVEKTLRGAVRSALANVEQALVAAASRRDLGMATLEPRKPNARGRR